MHSVNHWGGPLEIVGESQVDSTDDHRSQNADWDKASASRKSYTLDETQRSWLLDPETRLSSKKNKYVDLGCIICSRKALKWSVGIVALAFLVIGMPIIISKNLPENHARPLPPDDFTLALHKALLFFDEQKCKCTFFVIIVDPQFDSRSPEDIQRIFISL